MVLYIIAVSSNDVVSSLDMLKANLFIANCMENCALMNAVANAPKPQVFRNAMPVYDTVEEHK